MDINQNQPQTPQNTNFNSAQYDFITNPNQPTKTSLLGGGGQKQRILIVVLGALVLLIIFILVFSLIFGRGSGNANQMLAIGRAQTELMRVSELGERKAGSEQAKSLAVSTKLTMTSQQQTLIQYLQDSGQKRISERDLQTAPNSQTDQTLTTAETNGRFDEAFLSVMNEQLRAYRRLLQETYDSVGGENAKQLLSNDFNQINLLLGEN